MFFCVQSVIDAVRQINTDPARTPTALAVSFHSQDFKHCDFQELATNPDNLLLFTSLVVTTVFVAQVRKLFLFLKNIFEMVGNTNNFLPVRTRLIVSNCSSPHLFSSAPLSQLLSRFCPPPHSQHHDDNCVSQENTESGPVSGLLGVMMELFNVFPNLLAAFADIVGDIARGSDEDDEDEDDAEDTTNTNKLFIESTNEDVNKNEDGEDGSGSGEAPAGLFDPILNMLANIFPPTRQGDEDDEEGSGSGDGEEEVDNDIHIGVDVEPGSLLDMIINLIPGDEERDEDDAENTTEMGEMTTLSPEGEETIGGISVSLTPIDLANIFVQVIF